MLQNALFCCVIQDDIKCESCFIDVLCVLSKTASLRLLGEALKMPGRVSAQSVMCADFLQRETSKKSVFGADFTVCQEISLVWCQRDFSRKYRQSLDAQAAYNL